MKWDKFKERIFKRISENLSEVLFKLFSVSSERIMQKIREIEEGIAGFIKAVILNYLIKTALIILGIIFIFQGILKWLLTIFQPYIAYLILGVFSLVLALFIRLPSKFKKI